MLLVEEMIFSGFGLFVPTETAERSYDQTMVRVAWLYFKEGRTQGEIADLLATNRARINKLINEARNNGLVSIKLNTGLTSCIELEQELVHEFGLSRAIVLPTPSDPELIPVLLGEATAEFLTQLLASTQISTIGTGWGMTLREMVRFLPPSRYPNISVNSVIGGLTRGMAINTFDIASDLARQLGCECAYLAAPVYLDSPAARDSILQQTEFRENFERIVKSDVVLLSIGDLTERSLLINYGLPVDVPIQSLRDAGAVGDILGQFIDKNGQPIDHEINRRAIALPLESLSNIPNVVFAAGGYNKAHAIAGALRTGLGNVIICDEACARSALALAQAASRSPS